MLGCFLFLTSPTILILSSHLVACLLWADQPLLSPPPVAKTHNLSHFLLLNQNFFTRKPSQPWIALPRSQTSTLLKECAIRKEQKPAGIEEKLWKAFKKPGELDLFKFSCFPYICCISMYVSACFNKLLHIFFLFLAKFKEMRHLHHSRCHPMPLNLAQSK